MVEPGLVRAVAALVAQPRLLVALDFDGVLAPIVEHRDEARAVPGAMKAVRALAGCPGVEVALVSGRALASLRAASGVSDEDELSLIGSHGAETALRAALSASNGPADGPTAAAEPAPTDRLTPDQRGLLDRVVAALTAIVAAAGAGSGLEVETKPTGAVLHTRRATPEVAQRAETDARHGPGDWAGVHITLGKSVVELAVTSTSKGVALQQLRALAGADAVLYAGDDVTDETAFRVLEPTDVGVKVGPGDTHAAYRLGGPEDVRELLQLVVAERSQR